MFAVKCNTCGVSVTLNNKQKPPNTWVTVSIYQAERQSSHETVAHLCPPCARKLAEFINVELPPVVAD